MVSFHIQQETIAETLCINRFDLIPVCKGQCYLESQLKNDDKQERNLPDIKLKDTQLFFAGAFEFKFVFHEPLLAVPIPHFKTINHLNTYIVSIFHPPKELPVFLV